MRSLKNITVAISLALTGTLVAGCMGNYGANPPQDRITIIRDAYGVPHVYAKTTQDLFTGYGYVIAEDRLFQMEMARRSVTGTVAEVLGEAYVNHDVSTRSLFDPQDIQRQIDALGADDLAILQGYADGFNRRIDEVIADKANLLPKQFIDAGFEPTKWTPLDVAMLYVGTMVNRYSGSSSEVSNYKALTSLTGAYGDRAGRALFDQIYWLEDKLAPTTAPRNETLALDKGHAGAAAQEFALLETKSETGRNSSPSSDHLSRLRPLSVDWKNMDLASSVVGGTWPDARPTTSNIWIVGPDKTDDGSTMLLNGPQFGWFNPGYVFAVGLHGAGFDIVGNTPFALPVVLFGTNGKISWGATAGPLDVNDIYQETLVSGDKTAYLHKGTVQRMKVRTEIIKVKDKPDTKADVHSTVHGFVTSFDLANNTAYTKKSSWTGFEVQSLIAWVRATQAGNWGEFLNQASKVAHTINWYYADANGNIGYVSPGYLPKRPTNQDVRLPASGAGDMEWEGFLPFSSNPQVFNPAQDYVVNWNNQAGPGTLTDFGNYSIVDRVNELSTRIEAKSKLSRQDVLDLNKSGSFADLNARYILPTLLDATTDLPAGSTARIVRDHLAAWNWESVDANDDGYYDDVPATLMRKWVPLLIERVLKDDLPAEVFALYASAGYPAVGNAGSPRPAAGLKLVYNAMLGPRAGVPQTVDFFNGEVPATVLKETFLAAIAALESQFGTNLAEWKTPVATHLFKPQNFLGIPQANADEGITLAPFMNRGTENNLIVFKGGKAVSLCTVAPPGQSGFVNPNGVKSPHYADQLELYKSFGCKEEHLDQGAVRADAKNVKVLN